MPDYCKSKIYKLQCDDGYFYIGSSTQPLHKRFADHKKQSLVENSNVYKHINEIGWDKVRIILVEDYSCENKQQLVRKEDSVIRTYKDDSMCLNMRVAFRTEEQKQEYVRAKNKKRYERYTLEDKKRDSSRCKAYYQQHKEQIKERVKKYKQEAKTFRDTIPNVSGD